MGLGAMAAAPDKQQEAAQPSFGHVDTAALSQMNDIAALSQFSSRGALAHDHGEIA